jgi:A/G-specific adenine glycosylase
VRLSDSQIQTFQEIIRDSYRQYGRADLPWRVPVADGCFDPYFIMVSELMLQQTQVPRVMPKYEAFLAQFPTVQALATTNLGGVLRAWQGLGYNRRAKFLWQAAQMVVEQGAFPATVPELVRLPGIGPNTAGAILAYAYNQPAVFVETNIRTVYIHHFFADRSDVADTEIRELLEQTLDREHPREFYWALMDYGTWLKATIGNLNTASRHYAKQSKFHGSRRQIRGQIIRLLGERPRTFAELETIVLDERLPTVLAELTAEGLIREQRGTYAL